LPSRKVRRLTGFDSTVSAVPERISRASEAEALITAASRPERSITARAESFTIFGSSPKPK
jgi:hypothetical protein